MDQREAACSVLIEVMNILGAFKDDIVIVGGWVPDLTFPGKNHVGSLDVDLAVSPNAVGSDGAEAFQILTEKFDTLDSIGPQSVADVAEESGLDREQAQQAAFQDAPELFSEVQRIRSES